MQIKSLLRHCRSLACRPKSVAEVEQQTPYEKENANKFAN